MLRSALTLKGYRLAATDGAFGKVADMLFDDEFWGVRYLVAETGRWLPGRKVLIPPRSLLQPDWPSQTFPVSLSRKQIEDGPTIDADQSVSREHETRLHEHYGWQMYWSGPTAMGAWPAVVARSQAAEQKLEKGENHLRSLNEICGYHIQARDGSIGHVEDLIVDDEHWWMTYVIVDTKNWLPGRKVLISPAWVREFAWADRRVVVDMTREQIKESPKYDPSAPVNRAYEEQLYDYYGRPAYWAEMQAPHR
jgi:hypothetical protein